MVITNSRKNHKSLLSELDTIDTTVCRQNMSNFDSYVKSIEREVSLQTLTSHLMKAKANYRKRDLHNEEKRLEKIWLILRSEKFSNLELMNEGLLDYTTGTFLTAQKVKKRLN